MWSGGSRGESISSVTSGAQRSERRPPPHRALKIDVRPQRRRHPFPALTPPPPHPPFPLLLSRPFAFPISTLLLSLSFFSFQALPPPPLPFFFVLLFAVSLCLCFSITAAIPQKRVHCTFRRSRRLFYNRDGGLRGNLHSGFPQKNDDNVTCKTNAASRKNQKYPTCRRHFRRRRDAF